MDSRQQLEIIITGKVQCAVRDYLEGDWSRLPMLFTMPRSMFDSWADSIELPVQLPAGLPYGGVFRQKAPQDGIYVLRDADGWLVFRREKGIPEPGRVHATYRQAKRAALAQAFLSVLHGAV